MGTGDSQMIAGFILKSNSTVTIRALGPTLNSAFGVTGVLANPTMSVVNQATAATVVTKDDYATAASAAVAASGYTTGINSLESAVQVDLDAG